MANTVLPHADRALLQVHLIDLATPAVAAVLGARLIGPVLARDQHGAALEVCGRERLELLVEEELRGGAAVVVGGGVGIGGVGG